MPDQELASGPFDLRSSPFGWTEGCSFALNLLAIVAVMVLKLFVFPGEQPLQASSALHSWVQEQIPWSQLSLARPRLLVVNQTGIGNEPLPLGVALADASGKETVTVLGLEDGFELSLGTSRSAGSWVLTASEVTQAFVGPPNDFAGSLRLTVQLRSMAGQLLDSQPIGFAWLRAEQKPEQRLEATQLVQPTARPPDPVDVTAMIERGEALLRSGDIASARVLLRRAANEGSAQAAFELGTTFDPVFLRQLHVYGIDPDEAQAHEWYLRASKLGSSEASRELKRLAGEPAPSAP
jgi:hypothetical protein